MACCYWLRNDCNYGTACRRAHEHGLVGCHYGSRCPHGHRLDKTPSLLAQPAPGGSGLGSFKSGERRPIDSDDDSELPVSDDDNGDDADGGAAAGTGDSRRRRRSRASSRSRSQSRGRTVVAAFRSTAGSGAGAAVVRSASRGPRPISPTGSDESTTSSYMDGVPLVTSAAAFNGASALYYGRDLSAAKDRPVTNDFPNSGRGRGSSASASRAGGGSGSGFKLLTRPPPEAQTQYERSTFAANASNRVAAEQAELRRIHDKRFPPLDAAAMAAAAAHRARTQNAGSDDDTTDDDRARGPTVSSAGALRPQSMALYQSAKEAEKKAAAAAAEAKRKAEEASDWSVPLPLEQIYPDQIAAAAAAREAAQQKKLQIQREAAEFIAREKIEMAEAAKEREAMAERNRRAMSMTFPSRTQQSAAPYRAPQSTQRPATASSAASNSSPAGTGPASTTATNTPTSAATTAAASPALSSVSVGSSVSALTTAYLNGGGSNGFASPSPAHGVATAYTHQNSNLNGSPPQVQSSTQSPYAFPTQPLQYQTQSYYPQQQQPQYSPFAFQPTQQNQYSVAALPLNPIAPEEVEQAQYYYDAASNSYLPLESTAKQQQQQNQNLILFQQQQQQQLAAQQQYIQQQQQAVAQQLQTYLVPLTSGAIQTPLVVQQNGQIAQPLTQSQVPAAAPPTTSAGGVTAGASTTGGAAALGVGLDGLTYQERLLVLEHRIAMLEAEKKQTMKLAEEEELSFAMAPSDSAAGSAANGKAGASGGGGGTSGGGGSGRSGRRGRSRTARAVDPEYSRAIPTRAGVLGSAPQRSQAAVAAARQPNATPQQLAAQNQLQVQLQQLQHAQQVNLNRQAYVQQQAQLLAAQHLAQQQLQNGHAASAARAAQHRAAQLNHQQQPAIRQLSTIEFPPLGASPAANTGPPASYATVAAAAAADLPSESAASRSRSKSRGGTSRYAAPKSSDPPSPTFSAAAAVSRLRRPSLGAPAGTSERRRPRGGRRARAKALAALARGELGPRRSERRPSVSRARSKSRARSQSRGRNGVPPTEEFTSVFPAIGGASSGAQPSAAIKDLQPLCTHPKGATKCLCGKDVCLRCETTIDCPKCEFSYCRTCAPQASLTRCNGCAKARCKLCNEKRQEQKWCHGCKNYYCSKCAHFPKCDGVECEKSDTPAVFMTCDPHWTQCGLCKWERYCAVCWPNESSTCGECKETFCNTCLNERHGHDGDAEEDDETATAQSLSVTAASDALAKFAAALPAPKESKAPIASAVASKLATPLPAAPAPTAAAGDSKGAPLPDTDLPVASAATPSVPTAVVEVLTPVSPLPVSPSSAAAGEIACPPPASTGAPIAPAVTSIEPTYQALVAAATAAAAAAVASNSVAESAAVPRVVTPPTATPATAPTASTGEPQPQPLPVAITVNGVSVAVPLPIATSLTSDMPPAVVTATPVTSPVPALEPALPISA